MNCAPDGATPSTALVTPKLPRNVFVTSTDSVSSSTIVTMGGSGVYVTMAPDVPVSSTTHSAPAGMLSIDCVPSAGNTRSSSTTVVPSKMHVTWTVNVAPAGGTPSIAFVT